MCPGILIAAIIFFSTSIVECHKDGELGKAFLVKLNIDGSTCTASIIGDNWLITAAHCVEQIYLNLLNTGYKKETNYGDPELNLFDFPHLLDSYTAKKENALPATFNLNWTRPMENQQSPDISDPPNSYWRRIERIILHRNYSEEALSWQGYDIALIKLEVKNGDRIPDGHMYPACLPKETFDDYSNKTLFSAGYGWRDIPHCITDQTGPEKFQTCGREFDCTKNHRTKYCPLNFTDSEGTMHNECITNIPTPSTKSSECINLHTKKPELRNSTVHIFSENGTFLKSCFPAFLSHVDSTSSSKGWCTTRRPGKFSNVNPGDGSGWGFCSNDKSQAKCNTHIMQMSENDTSFPVSFVSDKFCFQQLKSNLEIEQPHELENKFEEKVKNSQTFCVGQFSSHDFGNEQFWINSNNTYTNAEINTELQNEFFDKGNAQRSYFDGGPGCFGDSGGPLWREVFDKKTNRKVPVLVGVFSFLLWGTCHGSQNPKYYGRVSSVVNWIKKYVPEEQICEYSDELNDHRPQKALECETEEWGDWIESNHFSSPVYYDTESSDGLEYYQDYDNYTASNDSYSEYYLTDSDFSSLVENCTCNNKNNHYESQTRKKSIAKEGTIGGIPCANIRETRNCKCPDIGNGVQSIVNTLETTTEKIESNKETGTDEDCSDASDNCSINGWMIKGCTSNTSVQKYCQKSCGLCKSSAKDEATTRLK